MSIHLRREKNQWSPKNDYYLCLIFNYYHSLISECGIIGVLVRVHPIIGSMYHFHPSLLAGIPKIAQEYTQVGYYHVEKTIDVL